MAVLMASHPETIEEEPKGTQIAWNGDFGTIPPHLRKK